MLAPATGRTRLAEKRSSHTAHSESGTRRGKGGYRGRRARDANRSSPWRLVRPSSSAVVAPPHPGTGRTGLKRRQTYPSRDHSGTPAGIDGKRSGWFVVVVVVGEFPTGRRFGDDVKDGSKSNQTGVRQPGSRRARKKESNWNEISRSM